MAKLKALIINCTLKKSPEKSNTELLARKAIAEFEKLDVETELMRLVDLTILPGTESNMGPGDEWGKVLAKIRAADILVIATPIWVGHTASTAQQLIERLDATFYEAALRDKETGQYVLYNKVAGVLVTGNEDGAHEVAGHIQWALGEFGATIPPNANAYWVGEAGPGPDYDEAGLKSQYTNASYRYSVHNLAAVARLLQKEPITTNLKELDKAAKKESQ